MPKIIVLHKKKSEISEGRKIKLVAAIIIVFLYKTEMTMAVSSLVLISRCGWQIFSVQRSGTTLSKYPLCYVANSHFKWKENGQRILHAKLRRSNLLEEFDF